MMNINEKAGMRLQGFPVQALASSVLMTLIAALWVTGYSFYSMHVLKEYTLDNQYASGLNAKLLELGGKLTPAAAMAASSSAPDIWEQHYQVSAEQLLSTIGAIGGHDPHVDVQQKIKDALKAYRNLHIQQAEVFAQLHHGDRQHALQMLDDVAYITQGIHFLHELQELNLAVEEQASAQLSAISQDMNRMMYSVAAMLVLVLATWGWSLRSITCWRREQAVTNA